MTSLFNVLASCGSLTFDAKLPQTTSLLVTIVQVAVPILLIFFGMLDLGKAVIAQKEDEIKKGQQTFIKRIIAAVIVFFVVVVVKLVIGLVADDSAKSGITGCIDCFISNKCGK